MTKREFLEMVSAGTMTQEIQDYAAMSIEKMDKANEARRSKSLERKAEKEKEFKPLYDAIIDQLTDEPKTAAQLIEEANVEFSVHKVPHLMKPLIEEGAVVKGQIKVGKGKRVGYRLAQ